MQQVHGCLFLMHVSPLVALSSYFEKGDSDEEPESKKGKVGGEEEEEEEEEEDDPLEAFMMGIEVLGWGEGN